MSRDTPVVLIMCSHRRGDASGAGGSRVAVSGVVGQVLVRPPSATARAKGGQVEQAGRATVSAVATEGGAAASMRSTADPMTSVVRDVLGRFLGLNEQVNEFVNRYVEVFVEQPDGLTAWRLDHNAGRIAESITFVDRAIALLIRASEDGRVGPSESDHSVLEDYRGQLRTARGLLTALGDDALARVASPESRHDSFDQLRTQTEAAWRATTGLFKMASAIVTGLLDRINQWAARSGTISESLPIAAHDPKSQSAVQVIANE